MNTINKIWNHYDRILASLALITLALSASYGVYTFQILFVPTWVAVVSAASFELTYIGLAFAQLSPASRQRAMVISLAAVSVSILYNGISAFFRLAPLALDTSIWYVAAVLAALHGLPLALVAYFVADLIIHQSSKQASTASYRGSYRLWLLDMRVPSQKQEGTQRPYGQAQNISTT